MGWRDRSMSAYQCAPMRSRAPPGVAEWEDAAPHSHRLAGRTPAGLLFASPVPQPLRGNQCAGACLQHAPRRTARRGGMGRAYPSSVTRGLNPPGWNGGVPRRPPLNPFRGEHGSGHITREHHVHPSELQRRDARSTRTCPARAPARNHLPHDRVEYEQLTNVTKRLAPRQPRTIRAA